MESNIQFLCKLKGMHFEAFTLNLIQKHKLLRLYISAHQLPPRFLIRKLGNFLETGFKCFNDNHSTISLTADKAYIFMRYILICALMIGYDLLFDY